MRGEIYVLCLDGTPQERALIARAVELAAVCSSPVRVLLTAGDQSAAQACIDAGAVEVRCLELDDCRDDLAVAQALYHCLQGAEPSAILCNATTRGRSIMPMLAAMLHTGLTADCTALEMQPDGTLIQTRPALGNHIMARITCRTRPQMATVRPGIFPPAPSSPRKGSIVSRPAQTQSRVWRRSFSPRQREQALGDAAIIFSGGAGLGSREAFETLRRLARQTDGCVGATRAAVNAGYAPYQWQIGQTGIAVRPKIYVAVAISGAVQHLAGMNGAETVIAINSDRRAPIFHYADYGFVGDWRVALETLLKKI